jgi:hypothetical protein
MDQPAKVEIAHRCVDPVRHLQRVVQVGTEVEFDLVKDPGH